MRETIEQLERIITNYYEGNDSLLDTAIQLHQIKNELNEATKLISDFIDENIYEIDDQSKDYPNGYRGYKFEYRNGGMNFDFSNCSAIIKLQNELKDQQELAKTSYNAMQRGVVMSDENGVIIEPANAKPRKSSLIIKSIK